MVAEPDEMPETMPDEEPTVAIAVLPELHVPEPVASVKVVVRPEHTLVLPDIPVELLLTVTNLVAIHPVLSVYVIIVVPGVRAVTIPEYKLTMATEELLLFHVPSCAASLNAVVVPAHKPVVPVIAGAPGLLKMVVV
jgi:hypothetical protein